MDFSERTAGQEDQTLFIEPGSTWENGYVESFIGKFLDEFLNGELFYIIWEGKVLVERWRREYKGFRLHSAFNYRPPAPKTFRLAALIPGSVILS